MATRGGAVGVAFSGGGEVLSGDTVTRSMYCKKRKGKAMFELSILSKPTSEARLSVVLRSLALERWLVVIMAPATDPSPTFLITESSDLLSDVSILRFSSAVTSVRSDDPSDVCCFAMTKLLGIAGSNCGGGV